MRKLLFLLIATIAAMNVTGAAYGQNWNGPNFRPLFEQSDLAPCLSILEGSKDQAAAIETLFTGMQSVFDAKLAALHALRDGLEERVRDGDESERARNATLRTAIGNFFGERARIDHRFEEDVKAVLTEHQVSEQWPAVERILRRRQLNQLGCPVNGWPRINLEKIMRQSGIREKEQTPEVARALEEWRLDVDRPLVERRQHLVEELARQGDSQPYGDKEAQAEYAISDRVEEINRRYFRRLSELMDGADGEKFRQSILELVYALRSEPRNGERAVTAALGMDDLAAEERERIKDRAARYATDSRNLERSAVERYDARRGEVRAFRSKPMAEQTPILVAGEDPAGKVYLEVVQERRKLEEETLRAIREMLSPRHRAILDRLLAANEK